MFIHRLKTKIIFYDLKNLQELLQLSVSPHKPNLLRSSDAVTLLYTYKSPYFADSTEVICWLDCSGAHPKTVKTRDMGHHYICDICFLRNDNKNLLVVHHLEMFGNEPITKLSAYDNQTYVLMWSLVVGKYALPIAADHQGHLYLCSCDRRIISILSAEGKCERVINLRHSPAHPLWLAIAREFHGPRKICWYRNKSLLIAVHEKYLTGETVGKRKDGLSLLAKKEWRVTFLNTEMSANNEGQTFDTGIRVKNVIILILLCVALLFDSFYKSGNEPISLCFIAFSAIVIVLFLVTIIFCGSWPFYLEI